jgi:hypothetical protein
MMRDGRMLSTPNGITAGGMAPFMFSYGGGVGQAMSPMHLVPMMGRQYSFAMHQPYIHVQPQHRAPGAAPGSEAASGPPLFAMPGPSRSHGLLTRMAPPTGVAHPTPVMRPDTIAWHVPVGGPHHVLLPRSHAASGPAPSPKRPKPEE